MVVRQIPRTLKMRSQCLSLRLKYCVVEELPPAPKNPPPPQPPYGPPVEVGRGFKPLVLQVSIPVFLTYLKSSPEPQTTCDTESMIRYQRCCRGPIQGCPRPLSVRVLGTLTPLPPRAEILVP